MRPGETPTVFSVTELNHAVRDLLEHSFGLLWVEGEISNLARPRSGHVYFSLKDGEAQVRCALFRNKARLLRVALDNGTQIRVRARVSLYAARGDYQLIVEHAEDAGAGALQRAFEELRARLDAEGLFAAERKRTLPASPARIGVITSATGAAIRDVLSVVSRRYPLGAVRVYPVPVQGEAAAPAISQAVTRAGERADCDVLLLVRGGGSLEDLWAFNDERVARAVVACPVPVVSGVGHEVDVTIADLAADVRAATPSAAAELVCPDLSATRARLPQMEQRLAQRMIGRLVENQRRLAALHQRLDRQRPRRRLETAAQRLDEAEMRLQRIANTRLAAARRSLQLVEDRLQRSRPATRVARQQRHVAGLAQRLDRAGLQRYRQAETRVRGVVRALHGVSPLQTVARGYAIARDVDGRVIRTAEAVSPGDHIAIDLARGRLDCEVQSRRGPETD
ncbi:exodeoxyribonuclease VII large subunit [Salinisphaera sp. Q1T1-3]|uniref:exodeoxyribonuclease VII large subunit n=1 Tax=Salinisphaera sp. Q1T1-3 TaxID=2321229 RepID=UPI000E7536E9|nr:exodeoxyribonuclease VII large subunit [Salinisphaera sp. Q1T1-3]RJS92319.1 exodeoxyribonuclease VII large subunit [Salinisphaera sp. Q1T1-3]